MSQIDVTQLVDKFKEQAPDLSFAAFKRAWMELQFSMIHLARVDGETVEAFMNDLYASIMAVLVEGDTETQLGCLYALYTCHLTCKGSDKVLIPVPLFCWEILKNLRDWALEHELPDPIHILEHLRTKNCIYFCADVRVGDDFLFSVVARATLTQPKQAHDVKRRLVLARQLGNEVTKADVLKDVVNIPLMQSFSKLYEASRTILFANDHSKQIIPRFSGLPWQSMSSSVLPFMETITANLAKGAELRAAKPVQPSRSRKPRKRTKVTDHLYETQPRPSQSQSQEAEPAVEPSRRSKRRGRPPDRLILTPTSSISSALTEISKATLDIAMQATTSAHHETTAINHDPIKIVLMPATTPTKGKVRRTSTRSASAVVSTSSHATPVVTRSQANAAKTKANLDCLHHSDSE
eukprot:c5877_g1_i2.p1 GENE.c5877_g1_i2~~c5877_g1_i2.p1  ORF type:complete len:418 (-),score=75.58 c5877_g1_i2:13-1236(-)